MPEEKDNKKKTSKEYLNYIIRELFEDDIVENIGEFDKQVQDIERNIVNKLNKAGENVKDFADKIKTFYESISKKKEAKIKRKPGRPLGTGKKSYDKQETYIILRMLEKNIITLDEAEALIEAINNDQ